MKSIIPEGMQGRHGVMSIEGLIASGYAETEAQIAHYRDFLRKTDYIIDEINEGLDAASGHADELACRGAAREKIAEISGAPPVPKMQKTVEERISSIEQMESGHATYGELAAAIREGVDSYGK